MSRFTPNFDCGHDPMAGGRRTTDGAHQYEEMRAELGSFWLLWVLSWPAIAAIGCFLCTPAGSAVLRGIWS